MRVAVAPLASSDPIHSVFLSSPPSVIPASRWWTEEDTDRKERIRRRAHPVVHPQGETYIALLLSLFRLPVWSHHTDISSSLAMASSWFNNYSPVIFIETQRWSKRYVEILIEFLGRLFSCLPECVVKTFHKSVLMQCSLMRTQALFCQKKPQSESTLWQPSHGY